MSQLVDQIQIPAVCRVVQIGIQFSANFQRNFIEILYSQITVVDDIVVRQYSFGS